MIPSYSLTKTEGKECHHCFFRSQYKHGDWDLAWNKVWLSPEDHKTSWNAPHQKIETAEYFRNLAFQRRYDFDSKAMLFREFLPYMDDEQKEQYLKQPNLKKEIRARKMNKKKSAYQRDVSKFKELNNGLSPYQVQYRKAKEYKASV